MASGCATPALVVPYHAAEAALIAQLAPDELRDRYSVQRITHNLGAGAASPPAAALAAGEEVTPLPPVAEEAAKPSASPPSILQLPKDSVWSEFIEVEQKLAAAAAPAKPPENLRPLARSPHAIRLHTTTIVAALRTAAKAEAPAPVSPQPSPAHPSSPAPLQPVRSPPSIAEAPYQKLLPAVVLDPLEHEVPPGEFAFPAPPPVREFETVSRPPTPQPRPLATVPPRPVPELGEFAYDAAPPAPPSSSPHRASPDQPAGPPKRLGLPIPEVGEFAPDSTPPAHSPRPPTAGIALPAPAVTPAAPQPIPTPFPRLPSTRDLWGAKSSPPANENPLPTPAEPVVLRPLEKPGLPLRSLLVVEQSTPVAQPTPAAPKLTEQPTPAAPKNAETPTPAAPKLSGQPTPAAPITAGAPTPAAPPALFTPVEPKHFFAMTSRRRGADPLSFGNPRPSDLAPESEPAGPAETPEDEAPVINPPPTTPSPQPKPLQSITPAEPESLAPPKSTVTGPPPADSRLIPQGVTQTLPLRGLSQISLDIRPPTLTDDQGQAFPAPRDAAAAVFAQAAPFERHEETQFMPPTHLAPGGLEFCYQPLYFEEVNAERYGHDYGPLQPVVSMGQFMSRIQWLPYSVFADPARHCTYHAHWTLPGYRIPYKEYPGFPYSAGGAAAEVAYVAGMIMIIP